MPHPFQASLTLDGQTLPGCAGDPATLLTGTWTLVDLPGATLSGLTFSNVQSAQTGTYSVVVSTTAGTAASTPVTLPVPMRESNSSRIAAPSAVTDTSRTL
mgnify:CR=1 FL=1